MSSIANVHKIIQHCPFWDSDVARDGKFLIISDTEAWNLLVPDNQSHILPKCETAKWVEFREGCTSEPLSWRIFFIDRSEQQIALGTTMQVFVPIPVPTRQKQSLLIHTRAGLQQRHMVRRVVAGDGY